MNIKSSGEIIGGEIRGAVDCLKSCVTPILSAGEKLEGVLRGSAVLIDVAGHVFLCTAKHVIEENSNTNLYFDGSSRLESLVGEFFCSGAHDVAVLKLSSSQLLNLNKYAPLSEDHIGNQDQASGCKYAEFLGFPESKNRAAYKTTKIKGLLYSNGGSVTNITSTRVNMAFDRNKNIDATTGMRVKAPDPHGMSGGAMFGARMNDHTIRGDPKPLLIGISTDWPEEAKEVFGTNIAVVMAIIRDAWKIALPARLNPKNMTTNLVVIHQTENALEN